MAEINIDKMAKDIAEIALDEIFYDGKTIRELMKIVVEADYIGKWIPVSERLPEEDGCYLVTTTGTNNNIIDIAYYTDDIWHKASKIKAWMPLPELYNAESEDK